MKTVQIKFTVLAMVLISGMSFGWVSWDNSLEDGIWGYEYNWNTDVLPTITDDVYLNDPWVVGRAVVDSTTTAFAGRIYMAHNFGEEIGAGVGNGTGIDVTGGSLTVADFWAMGAVSSVVQHVDITGGNVTVGEGKKDVEGNFTDRLTVGDAGTITMNLAGGVVDVNGELFINTKSKINMSGSAQLKVSSDYSEFDPLTPAINYLADYVSQNRVIAYDGRGVVVVTYDSVNNRLIATASYNNITDIATAYAPSPADDAVLSSAEFDLAWKAGYFATSHNVYLSTNELDVINGAPAAYKGSVLTPSYDPGILTKGLTYYWRVDEVDAVNTYTGMVWSFSILADTAASLPSPVDGAVNVPADADLSWTSGLGAVSHNVYLGTNVALVQGRDASVFKGSVTTPAYDPGLLKRGTTYYWCVDEVVGSNTYPGAAWTFTTVNPPQALAWTGNDPVNNYWNDPDNWGSPADTPGLNTDVAIYDTANLGIPEVASGMDAECKILRMGGANGQTDTLNITGGTLTSNSIMGLCEISQSKSVVNVTGGTMTFADIWVGNRGQATININGGHVVASGVDGGRLWIPRFNAFGVKGTVNLTSGTLTAAVLDMSQGTSTTGLINIEAGKMYLNGNQVANVDAYVAANKIKAYGGTKVVRRGFDPVADKTLVWACSAAGDGDVNGDCVTNSADLVKLAEQWLLVGTGYSADLNKDGSVTLADFATVAKNWTN